MSHVQQAVSLAAQGGQAYHEAELHSQLRGVEGQHQVLFRGLQSAPESQLLCTAGSQAYVLSGTWWWWAE